MDLGTSMIEALESKSGQNVLPFSCHALHNDYLPQMHELFEAVRALDAALGSSSHGYLLRLCIWFYAISIAACTWVFFVARPLQPGLLRALLCLPVAALQLAATPLLVDRQRWAVLVVPVMGVLSLSAFKVAAFGIGRGPLALPLPWLNELLKFGAVLTLPVIPRQAFKVSQGTPLESLSSSAPATPGAFLTSYAAKAGGATFAAAMAVAPLLPVLLRHWFYALCLSLSIGAIWDFWCLVPVLCFGIEVAPSFDKPWLSTSFADYWSRRWNLTTTYMLRVLIYEPVMEAKLVPAAIDNAAEPAEPAALDSLKQRGQPRAVARHIIAASGAAVTAAAEPAGQEDDEPAASATSKQQGSTRISDGSSPAAQSLPAGAAAATSAAAGSSPVMSRRQRLLRRLLALHATFAFSGLWHTLIFYYATGLVTPHWFAFFSVQAPIMAAEAVLVRWCKARGLLLRRPVAIFLTNFLLIVVANPLFFGPCDWSGLCSAMFDNVSGRRSGAGQQA